MFLVDSVGDIAASLPLYRFLNRVLKSHPSGAVDGELTRLPASPRVPVAVEARIDAGLNRPAGCRPLAGCACASRDPWVLVVAVGFPSA